MVLASVEAGSATVNGGKISVNYTRFWDVGIPHASTHTVTPRDGQARARPRRVPAAALALAPSARLLLEEGDRLRSGDRTQELDRKTDLTDRQTGISDGAPSTEDTRAGHSTARTAELGMAHMPRTP